MTTNTAIFQSTISKSSEWVQEVMSDLGIRDEHKGLRALRAGLHAIRDRLPPSEAVQLAAQMPALIRGYYFEGWRFAESPARMRSTDDLIAAVQTELGNDPTMHPEAALRATIHVLAWHVSQGELDDVASVLPRKIAELWNDSLA